MEKLKNRIFTVIGNYGLPAGFFIFFFIYLLVYIDPRIVYTCNGFDLYPYVHFTCTGEISKANIVDHHLYGDHRYILELTPSYLKGIVSVPGGLTEPFGDPCHLCLSLLHYRVAGGYRNRMASVFPFPCIRQAVRRAAASDMPLPAGDFSPGNLRTV